MLKVVGSNLDKSTFPFQWLLFQSFVNPKIFNEFRQHYVKN